MAPRPILPAPKHSRGTMPQARSASERNWFPRLRFGLVGRSPGSWCLQSRLHAESARRAQCISARRAGGRGLHSDAGRRRCDQRRGRLVRTVRPVRRERPHAPARLEVAPVRQIARVAYRPGTAALDADARRRLHAVVIRRRTVVRLARLATRWTGRRATAARVALLPAHRHLGAENESQRKAVEDNPESDRRPGHGSPPWVIVPGHSRSRCREPRFATCRDAQLPAPASGTAANASPLQELGGNWGGPARCRSGSRSSS
jgi:hypothetical protein